MQSRSHTHTTPRANAPPHTHTHSRGDVETATDTNYSDRHRTADQHEGAITLANRSPGRRNPNPEK